MPATPKTALISGASIAGPATAYWLNKYGIKATVVEKSATIRLGGYPIDVRGTAMEACTRMGLRERLFTSHIATKRLTFVDADGKVIGSVRPEAVTGGVEGRDVEIPRGDLTTLLYEAAREDVEYLFNDSIESLVDGPDGVDVTFRSGLQRRFDVVIGADGLHSNVRKLAFGPESQYEKYIGYYFVGFSAPNFNGMSREGMSFSAAGRNTVQYAVGDKPETVFSAFSFPCETPPPFEERTTEIQLKLFTDIFTDSGWIANDLLAALPKDDGAFYDTVSQIHMPGWTKGRVALVGDAGYAASFLSGQGSSLAIVGAYVLGNEIGSQSDLSVAFANYERIMRPFVDANQAIVKGTGRKKMIASGPVQAFVRKLMLRYILPAMDVLKLGRFAAGGTRKATTAITLPDYPQAH